MALALALALLRYSILAETAAFEDRSVEMQSMFSAIYPRLAGN